DLASALETILTRMGELVRSERPRIPNPVNPAEDFADKWYDAAYTHLNLEKNFWDWLRQAQVDFEIIGESLDPDFITEQAMSKFTIASSCRSMFREPFPERCQRSLRPVGEFRASTRSI